MAFRQTFTTLVWSGRLGDWIMDQRTGEEDWAMRLVSSLVGQVVNIGDKDGGVYEGVTVTAFDERRGYLTLEGGACGSWLRPEDARPLEGQVSLHVHDVARGYINEAA
jgi:hypothetical protein